jgi:hypothetical protein
MLKSFQANFGESVLVLAGDEPTERTNVTQFWDRLLVGDSCRELPSR